MTAQDLQAYLTTHIPLTQAMQIQVLSIASDELILQAPLEPNKNPHHTVFGGSIATILTVAAWSLVHTRLESEQLKSTLVVRRSALEYERPIAGAFTARAYFAAPEQWEHFTQTFHQKGKAKLEVLAVLEYANQVCARFKGEFVALATH
ncbi:YiiD C-terminal domain-containing protein [Thiofilum flexile]|uniref:YiiD C-terminal domain-containing protein n=1 Tax=Thiofilum flexile TaxID=125627 RepID=UPI000378ED87|nr:YiiD C-terminal domain-containing protein [Thiofilum flexile]